jgi:hypothetical protein
MHPIVRVVGELAVKDQVHIRNAEAAQLVRALARQTGKTMTEVMLDALRQYRPTSKRAPERNLLERWRRLLREDRKNLAREETPIEAMYDDATGLPL